MSRNSEQLITDMNAHDFFHESLHSALARQQMNASGETVIYITNLLTGFLFAERFHDCNTGGRRRMATLAMMYGDALHADTRENRQKALQRLGDVALFVSGLFARSLSRSLVDVDYYIAMGGNAYGSLADSRAGFRNPEAMRDVFQELAERFGKFVDVLGEVGEQVNLGSNDDILRWYEIWLCSGSSRALEKLRALGIEPISMQQHKH
ncbi:MAG: hypothetical protein WD750_12525 [Gammaproteobacteria bacterium]